MLQGSNSRVIWLKFEDYKVQTDIRNEIQLINCNARADLLNMDIGEVQTNITTSKSGFETSQLLQRGQPLRSHVWG